MQRVHNGPMYAKGTQWSKPGAYYNRPQFKCDLESGTGWLFFKILPKNSKTHMVNLLKNLRSFWNYILKIQWEIHFLTFSNTDQNAKKIKTKKYLALYWKTALKTDFGPWRVPQPGNAWKWKCMFSISGTFRIQNQFLKQVSNKLLYIYFLFKKLKRFVSIWKSQKMDFSLYF